MKKSIENNKLEACFRTIVHYPRLITFGSLLLIVIAGLFLPSLEKDTRSDAFLAVDNPALVYKRKIKEQFGLADPIVVAVVDNKTTGIYNPATLRFIKALSTELSNIANVDANRVTSLATQANIQSRGDDLIISPFLDPLPEDEVTAATLREQLGDFPLYQGSLVAVDGHVTLVVAEMIDESRAGETYQAILKKLESITAPPGVEIHVAGEGAITGYLGRYIDSDAMRLNPLAGLIITLVIIIAFLRFNPALLCNVIIAASVLITLGLMAALGIPFFVVTSALPVILVGISVADSIHIYSGYYERQLRSPEG